MSVAEPVTGADAPDPACATPGEMRRIFARVFAGADMTVIHQSLPCVAFHTPRLRVPLAKPE